MEYYENSKYPANENIKRMRTSTDAYVDGLSNEELNIGPEKSTFYRNMYKSVIDKYILGNDVSDAEIQEETKYKEISGEPENVQREEEEDKKGGEGAGRGRQRREEERREERRQRGGGKGWWKGEESPTKKSGPYKNQRERATGHKRSMYRIPR